MSHTCSYVDTCTCMFRKGTDVKFKSCFASIHVARKISPVVHTLEESQTRSAWCFGHCEEE